MLKRNSVEKLLRTTFIVALIMAIGLPAFAAKVPASKTKAQQILEAKEAEEQTITEDESVAAPEKVAVENLPEDTTPRYSLSTISFSGNALFTDEQLLDDLPDIFNAAKDGSIETDNLYDIRGLKAIVAEPGIAQDVSARSIQGFTQYILSIYQNKHYAGIYVYVPGEAFEVEGDLAQGILPIRILEAPVSNLSSAYYDVNNVPTDPNSYYLRVTALEGWSPVQEGKVINRKKLDDYINLLNLNPDRYVAAVVSKGTEPDSLAVNYNVYEANPWHYFIQVDNSGTDDIQWRPRFGLINTNLLGYDDKLTAVYQAAPDSSWDEEFAIYGSYDFPILGPKLRLNLFAGYNEFDIADPDINFLGRGSFYGGTLRYNALQTDDWFFDLTGTLSHEESKVTPDLGLPIGSDIHMTLWGAGTELYKTTDMTDTFFGFNVVGLLNSSNQVQMNMARSGGASDDFKIYYLTARHSRYLDTDKIQRLSASARLITSDDRLVQSKMTSFGGMYTVRGYDEYEIIGDGGLITSLQYEYDLIRKGQVELFGQEVDEKTRKPYLKKLAPLLFLDYGQARIKDPVAGIGETADQELASVGCGLITELGDNITGTVYYGYPLIETDDTRSGKGRVHAGFLLRW